MATTPHKPACLIPLPGGPGVSGVARFAVRLAGGLAERGHAVGLLLHAPTADVPPLDLPVSEGVRVIDCRDLPPVETTKPDVFRPGYERAIDELGGGEPCVLVLGQHAAVFSIAASLEADTIRSVGVAHSDNSYDSRVLTHYEPILHAMVGVSDEIAADLHRLNPGRSGDTRGITYGVEIPDSVATREPIGGRPLRLLYAGRLEHRQKRVLALASLSAELDRRRIAHTLTIVGDGPARDELADACQNLDSVTIAPPAGPDEIAKLLDAHDAFVLPSRFEGLSIAMLEALAHGCILVVAPSRSGTAQAVLPGKTGEIARVTPDADEPAVGIALADAVDALRRRDLAEMSERCHAHAAEHFSIDAHITRWSELLEHTTQQTPRHWPPDRPKSFGTTGG
ncbi:MAG: glycosyltransferase family 4 protein, partial [Planctomycetota bacterium]